MIHPVHAWCPPKTPTDLSVNVLFKDAEGSLIKLSDERELLDNNNRQKPTAHAASRINGKRNG